MQLSQLPDDILDNLLSFFHRSEVVYLWFTGDTQLQKKLSRAHNVGLELDPILPTSWPSSFLANFGLLYNLEVSYAPVISNFGLTDFDPSCLPSSLRSLTLGIPGCFASLASGLASTLPYLQSLTLNEIDITEATLLHPLPSSLTHLTLGTSFSGGATLDSSWLTTLPDTLLYLDIMQFQLFFLYDQAPKWPTQLLTLRMQTAANSTLPLRRLPLSLTYLDLQLVEGVEDENVHNQYDEDGDEEIEDTGTLWKWLPSSLQTLFLYYDTLDNALKLPSPFELPPGLKCFVVYGDRMSRSTGAAYDLADYLKALPKLELIQEDHFASRDPCIHAIDIVDPLQIPHMDYEDQPYTPTFKKLLELTSGSNLTHLVVRSSIPPILSRIFIDFDTFAGLTALSLQQRTNYPGISYPTIQICPEIQLPKGLTSLSFGPFSDQIFDLELPPRLTSLTLFNQLGPQYFQQDEKNTRKLPSSLDSFVCYMDIFYHATPSRCIDQRGVAKHSDDWNGDPHIFNVLPRGLKKLMFSANYPYIADNAFYVVHPNSIGSLPPALTTLTTSAPLGSSFWKWMKNLPSNIPLAEFYTDQYTDVPDRERGPMEWPDWPSSLITLNTAVVDMESSEWRKLPPRLRELTLSYRHAGAFNKLRKEDIQRLPKSLTYLKIVHFSMGRNISEFAQLSPSLGMVRIPEVEFPTKDPIPKHRVFN